MLKALLDIVFPPMCLLCGKRALKKGFCEGCMGLIEKERITGPACAVCAVPFPSAKGVDHVCGQCLEEPPAFTAARSAFAYEGCLLDAIHKFKYGGDTSLADPLASLALGQAALEGQHLIVPVPLYTGKLRERGFNQSLLIARALSRLTASALVYDRLRRTRDTGQQVGLKALERKKNVAGAFALEDPGLFKGRRVLLVDDVMTTGATMNECAKLLRRAGAEVFGLSVARTLKV